MRRLLAAAALITAVLVLPATAQANKLCGATSVTIAGTSAADNLYGTEGDDVIRSGRGDDHIYGGGGNDVICAGPGRDYAEAANGSDRVRGGGGDDRLFGGEDDDQIAGQGGTDYGAGEAGIDVCQTEDQAGCEADISVLPVGTPPFTAGDNTISYGQLQVSNYGPSPSGAILAVGTLPEEAEFVASQSDPRCREHETDVIGCDGDPIDVDKQESFSFAFRFPDCPTQPNQQVTFVAEAFDFSHSDQNPGNNRFTIAAGLKPAPSCP